MTEKIVKYSALAFMLIAFFIIVELLTGESFTLYGWLYWMGGFIFHDIWDKILKLNT